MDEDLFKIQVEAVHTQLSEKDKNLKEQFDRYWGEIVMHRNEFDRQKKECEEVRKIKLGMFKGYFEAFFFEEATKLDIHLNSEAHQEQEAAAEKENPCTA